MTDLDAISGDVVDAAVALHRNLGPGLLESVYEMILASKLARSGYTVQRQRPVDIQYEGIGGETLKEGLRRVVNDYHPSAPSRLRVNQ